MLVVRRDNGRDAGAPLPPQQSVERPAESTLESGGKGDGLERGQMPTHAGLCISKMYFSHWKTPGVSERMWSVNLDASISGEYQTLGGHSGRPSE